MFCAGGKGCSEGVDGAPAHIEQLRGVPPTTASKAFPRARGSHAPSPLPALRTGAVKKGGDSSSARDKLIPSKANKAQASGSEEELSLTAPYTAHSLPDPSPGEEWGLAPGSSSQRSQEQGLTMGHTALSDRSHLAEPWGNGTLGALRIGPGGTQGLVLFQISHPSLSNTVVWLLLENTSRTRRKVS